MTLAYMLNGQMNWQESSEFVEDEGGGPPNTELARTVYPYARMAMYIFSVGRIILLFASMKWLRVTKCFFYYEQIFVVIEVFLPYNISHKLRNVLLMMTGSFNFISDYFHFFPSMIISCFQFLLVAYGRQLFYDEEPTSKVIFMVVNNMILQAFSHWGAHMALSYLGMLMVEAETVRTGEQHLMDSLEEGLIILDNQSQ